MGIEYTHVSNKYKFRLMQSTRYRQAQWKDDYRRGDHVKTGKAENKFKFQSKLYGF